MFVQAKKNQFTLAQYDDFSIAFDLLMMMMCTLDRLAIYRYNNEISRCYASGPSGRKRAMFPSHIRVVMALACSIISVHLCGSSFCLTNRIKYSSFMITKSQVNTHNITTN